MNSINLSDIISVLDDTDHFLRFAGEDHYNVFITDENDETFTHVTYDSREVSNQSLLICKGNFTDAYMREADKRGLVWYVSEEDYSHVTSAFGIIVDDVRKAMALIAQEFYDHPEDKLTLVGITGTKGKSTTTYYTHAILNNYFDHKVALLSSVDNCVDGVNYVESDLTTPESLDLYRLMREAVDNGMTHMVMEVSSQAYKLNRVYNLWFSVGAFLNIFPDHIGPIEHPDFDDYFMCKRSLIFHSETAVIGAEMDYRDIVEGDARSENIPVHVFSSTDIDHNEFKLAMLGEFNYANAAAACAIARTVGVPADSPSMHALEDVRLAGRMEIFEGPNSTIAIVDYAHNGISTTALMDFIHERYDDLDPYIMFVGGCAGNKAFNRRAEIVEAAQNRISEFVFTTEDTDTEPNEEICAQMAQSVTNPNVKWVTIVDRTEAITDALTRAMQMDRPTIVAVYGKGDERWIKAGKSHVPYDGDDAIVKRLFGL